MSINWLVRSEGRRASSESSVAPPKANQGVAKARNGRRLGQSRSLTTVWSKVVADYTKDRSYYGHGSSEHSARLLIGAKATYGRLNAQGGVSHPTKNECRKDILVCWSNGILKGRVVQRIHQILDFLNGSTHANSKGGLWTATNPANTVGNIAC